MKMVMIPMDVYHNIKGRAQQPIQQQSIHQPLIPPSL